MRRLIIGAIIFGGFWIYNNGYLDPILGSVAPSFASGGGGGDAVVGFADGDAKMGAAMATAQDTLPRFLANQIDANGNGVGNTSVKVAFDADGGGLEIIWVGSLQWDGDTGMEGNLNNQPNFMGDLNAGDRVTFSTDMVRDWSVVTNEGAMFGNYTTRVIVPQLDADTQAALNAMLSPDPIPADWN